MTDIRHCPTCGAELSAGAAEEPCPACLMKLALASGAAWDDGGSESPTEYYGGGFVAPPIEELAPHFPHLEILELVGRGGMGAVYKARQKSLDRVVAVKIINPVAAKQPGFAERFAREARAMARMNHANIVTIHDFGETAPVLPDAKSGGTQPEPLFYLVMELVDGANLRALMRHKRLEPAEAIRIVPPLCDALQYAHEEGIVHRDIKPENILIDQKGRVKIADFGLAKLLGRTPRDITLTEAHHALGTLHYMAPEQLERPLEVDHRADIYALGVTFYEMLTGELPIGRFALPSQKAQLDVRLDEIVLRALEREPERRYQHASDVKSAVQSCEIQPAVVRTASDALLAPAIFAPGSGPRMLALALGLATSSLVIAMGAAMLIYGVAAYPAGEDQWSGFVGGGFGSLVGGLGGFVGCWNKLRMTRGQIDLMYEPHWNWLDSVFLVYGALGIASLVVGAIWWPSLNLGLRITAIILGSIATFQGVGFAAWRLALRRAAARPSAEPGLDLRLVLIAVSMVVCVLLFMSGFVLIVIAAIRLPIGSDEFWGWIGAASGFVFGGGGGMLGTWNSYRAMEGLPDWMSEGTHNVLDRCLYTVGGLGAAVMVTGIAASAWLTSSSMYALELLGGILVFQASIFLSVRALMRRAARQEAEQKG